MYNDKNLINYLELANHHPSNSFIEDQYLNC